MGFAILGLAGIVGLVNFVCFVMVLMKLFTREGVGKGIFGLICGLYTFVWGWQNADAIDSRKIMQVWTGALVINIILNVAARAVAG